MCRTSSEVHIVLILQTGEANQKGVSGMLLGNITVEEVQRMEHCKGVGKDIMGSSRELVQVQVFGIHDWHVF